MKSTTIQMPKRFGLLLPMLWWLATISAATAEQYGDFTYEINTPDTNTVTITVYTGAGGDVEIPSNIVGKAVTIIGYRAFKNEDALTNVTIPHSVTTIEDQAFNPCGGLTSVTIGSGVTSIGNQAFGGCGLLANVTIGSSVTNIGRNAFIFCAALTSVTIPDSVTTIGTWAFNGCHALTSVNIPDSVSNIGEGAFVNCAALLWITVSAGNLAYSDLDGVLFNLDQTILLEYPGGRAGSYSVPISVTSIGNAAFRVCRALTSVTIPDSVTSIGDGAFRNCDALTSVYFAGDAPAIGSDVYLDSSPTIYYLAGTTGWGPTFGGRPTAIWTLPKLTDISPPSLPGGHLILNVGGTPTNMTVVVRACTNISDPAWVEVGTATLVNGTNSLADEHSTNYPIRIYCVTPP